MPTQWWTSPNAEHTYNRLGELIESATSASCAALDAAKLKEIKTLVRRGGNFASRRFHELVMSRLRSTNSLVRLHSLSLLREPFRRCSDVRRQAAPCMKEIVELTVGPDIDHRLPPPENFGAKARSP